MSDAWLDGWREVGVSVQEIHTDFAESAQGVATDGERWFVVSNRAVVGIMRKISAPTSIFGRNRNTRRVGVYDVGGTKAHEIAPEEAIWTELVRRNRVVVGGHAIHFGAPTWVRDTLLVPTQRPSGVWILADNLTRQDWWPDPLPEWPERYSWIDQEPASGLLFTSLYRHPRQLQALEWGTLRRAAAADVTLELTEPPLDRVQGGAFTGDRVVLTSSSGRGRVSCHSSVDGRSLGVREFTDYAEMEGIAIRTCRVGGQDADIHILDAGTHYWPFIRWGDNFSVRSYAVTPGVRTHMPMVTEFDEGSRTIG
jgi:hypothetical protein